ncbi:MAG: type 4a pilus biogenesis protein PilO [Rhodothermales bacterium]|nr:type 4a pilus biogenesis protein PilO [Rhodothermales bacterium]
MHPRSEWFAHHRWRGLAAGVALLCVYGVLGELAPRAGAAYAAYGAWQRQEATIASMARWDEERQALSHRKRRLQQRFAALYVSLPRSDQMSTLLQVLQESASAAGVDVRHVRPAEHARFATYDELPFAVEVTGDFHALGAFINRIEQSPYVIKLKGFEIRRPAVAARLHATLSLSVIALHEQRGSG